MRFNNHETKGSARETHAQPHNSHAFTLIELLTILVITVTLLGVFLIYPMMNTGCKAPRGRIKCVNNLKNIGLAVRIYATDNNDHFPWEIPDQKGEIHINYLSDPAVYIRDLTNELSTPKILICPGDNREEATNWTQFSRTNLTYFISPDAAEPFPNSFLAGDRNITNILGRLPPGLRALSTARPCGWDETIHKNQGNACMADGSVQQLSSARLREQLRNTGLPNNHIKLSMP